MEPVRIGEVIAPKSTSKVSKGETRSLGTQVCKDCQCVVQDFVQECVIENFGGKPLWYPWYPLCPDCLSKREKEAQADERPKRCERREKEFMEMCPLSMRETDASRLNPLKLSKIIDHPLNGRGLIITGKTGMGKTRSMWLLIRDMMVNRGLDVRVYDSSEIKQMLADSYTVRHAHKDLIEGLCRCEVLCIDDLGKEKTTDAWEQDLFTIVDRRMLHKKPIVITTNYLGSSMIERYRDVHRIEPMVRRLREFCDCVVFDRYPTE